MELQLNLIESEWNEIEDEESKLQEKVKPIIAVLP